MPALHNLRIHISGTLLDECRQNIPVRGILSDKGKAKQNKAARAGKSGAVANTAANMVGFFFWMVKLILAKDSITIFSLEICICTVEIVDIICANSRNIWLNLLFKV